MIWILCTLFYGLAKGGREICKKKALMRNEVMEVLFFHTLLSFLFVVPEVRNAGGLPVGTYLLIALKSFVIFVAWMCSFNAIKRLPISLMGILELSRVLFATLLGVVFLKETMGANQIAGLIFVSIGLLILPLPNIIQSKKTGTKVDTENVKIIFVVIALVSCMLNAVSSTMDKYLMSTELTSGQLQFWYMFFMVVYYSIYVLVKRIKINWKSLLKNYWIWILSVLFVLADRALFIANADPDSKVTIMTLIKQSCCVVSIVGGKLIFKEKNILFKLFCAGIIVAGILLTVLI